MSASALSLFIFALVIGGILLGSWLRNALPDHHLSKDSQDAVRLGVGLISTIAALVLGLLISSAKSTFDTQSSQVKQITTDIILLDTLLAEYGREALPITSRDPKRDRSFCRPALARKAGGDCGAVCLCRGGGKGLSGHTGAGAAERRAEVSASPSCPDQHRFGANAPAAICRNR